MISTTGILEIPAVTELSSFPGSLPTKKWVFTTKQSINHKSTHCAGCYGEP